MLNYKFPIIENINDVLPHIEGKSEFRVFDKEWYIVINYMVAFEETFEWDISDPIGSAIRRECRGLIFNSVGELISRPYSKFFNIGEKQETLINKVNLYEPHVVLEKLDGSMIRPIPTKEGFRLATKAGVTDVAMNAEVFISDKKNYKTFIEKCIQKGTTPIFEWCSRKNRIVVDYPEDQLILTGIRYLDTGAYVTYKVMTEYANAWDIPVVKAIDGLSVQNIELFVEQIREWDDGEGVVLRFDTGHMIKVKADEYVLRHRIKSTFNQEKSIIQVILDDSVDDVIPLLSDSDKDTLYAFQKEFWKNVESLTERMGNLYDCGNIAYPVDKDFAVNFVQKLESSEYSPIMYGMRRGKSAKEIIIGMIEKSLSTQNKIDSNRWLFGGIDWNNVNTFNQR